MFDLTASKEFRRTEERVTSFIITRFSDPVPGYPLSVSELEKIFSKNVLPILYGFSTEIANGIMPNIEGLLFFCKRYQINFKTLLILTRVLYNYLKGLEMDMADIELMNLGYDYVPPYMKSEDYRHINLVYTVFERIINYCEN